MERPHLALGNTTVNAVKERLTKTISLLYTFTKKSRCENMNLNSLPDELIAGIFKYNSCKTVRNIRKMDSRLNTIAMKYDLGVRVPAEEVYFEVMVDLEGDMEFIECTLVAHVTKNFCTYSKLPYNEDKANLVKTLEKGTWQQMFDLMKDVLSKVQVRTLSILLNSEKLSDPFMSLLIDQKRSFRKLVSLTLRMCQDQFLISRTKVADFFASSRKLQEFAFHGTSGLDTFMNAEVCGHRKWTTIDLTRIEIRRNTVLFLKTFDKDFLHNVIKNTNSFIIHNRKRNKLLMALTALEFLDFIEACLLEDGFFHHQHWQLPAVSLGNMTREGIIERLAKNKIVEISFEDQVAVGFVLCDIYINPLVRISFVFDEGNRPPSPSDAGESDLSDFTDSD